jgi:hypothetical protein
MFKKLLEMVFRSKENVSKRIYLTALVNDRIMPIGRGDVYEDPLDEFLKAKGYGNVTGGGTLQELNGEIKYCDLEIEVDEERLTENDDNKHHSKVGEAWSAETIEVDY